MPINYLSQFLELGFLTLLISKKWVVNRSKRLQAILSQVSIVRCVIGHLLKVRSLHPSMSTSCINRYSQESTRKRHYYYCRSKQHDTSTSRKRSCVACVHAKTRCAWPADTSLDACVRCNKRGVKCEYDTAVRRHGVLSLGESSAATALDEGRDLLDIEDRPTTSNLAQQITYVNDVNDLQVGMPTRAYRETNEEAPFGLLLDGNWDTGLREANILGFSDPELLETQDIECMGACGMISTELSPLVPFPRLLPSISLFNSRVFIKPDHIPLVSLAKRILRSYTSMIVPKGVLPPFMSPWLYSSTETSGVPSQQVSCSILFAAVLSLGIGGRELVRLPVFP